MSQCSDPPSAFCDEPAGLPPTGPAGGDLTGTFPNPVLVAILAGGTFGDATHVAQVTVDSKGRITAVAVVTIAGTAPGGPAGGDLAGTYPNPVLAAIFAGGTFADATHVAQITVDTKGRITAVSSVLISGTAPGGPAGGDLAGTYPSPTLAAILAGGTFGDDTHVAQVTVDTKGRVTAASSVLITGTVPGGGAGGDLAGTYPNPALAAIIAGGSFGDATHVAAITVDTKGRITAASAVLITGTAPGGSAGGDLAGTYPNPTLAAILAGGTFGSAANAVQVTVDTKGRITAIANVAITGRFIGLRVLVSGTSYSPTSGTTSIVVTPIGGGGGGGGAATAAGQAAAGGGGASGGMATKRYTGIGAGPYTYAIGGGGGGGSTAGGNGGGGGDTTFTDGTTLVTAKGGQGGLGEAAGAAFAFVDGGSGVISTLGDINGAGAPGQAGIRQNGLTAMAGMGGSTPYGGGGAGRSTNGAGNAGIGIGSGGGGALVQNGSAAVAGGGGQAGALLIEEYA